MHKTDFPTPEMTAQAQTIAARAAARGLQVATAESCTGGMVAAALTELAGASEWFLGGVVAYDNDLKRRLLAVPDETLSAHGAVSAETARAMVAGLAAYGATAALSVTGIAGPGGGEEGKPVGTVWFGFQIAGAAPVAHQQCFAEIFAETGRRGVRCAAAVYALATLAAMLRA